MDIYNIMYYFRTLTEMMEGFIRKYNEKNPIAN